MKHVFFTAVLLFSMPLFAAQPTSQPSANQPCAPQSIPPIRFTSVRFTLDVIEATTDERGLTMDFQKIDSGKNRVDAILSELQKIGSAAVTFRYDSRVMTFKPFTLSNGLNTPYVTGSNISSSTKNITHSIAYKDIGSICKFMIKDAGQDYLLEGSVNWSNLVESGIMISENVQAKSFCSMQLDVSSKLQCNQPILLGGTTKIPSSDAKAVRAQVVLYRIMISPISE